VVGPTQDRYYLDPDDHQKCEELRWNQPLFLISSVRHWTHLESILPSRMGRIEIEVPQPVQNIWMFANWYADLNLFSFPSFPPFIQTNPPADTKLINFGGGSSRGVRTINVRNEPVQKNVLCSETWIPPRTEVETLWVSTWKKHINLKNKFDCVPPKDGLIALWPSTNGRVSTF